MQLLIQFLNAEGLKWKDCLQNAKCVLVIIPYKVQKPGLNEEEKNMHAKLKFINIFISHMISNLETVFSVTLQTVHYNQDFLKKTIPLVSFIH